MVSAAHIPNGTITEQKLDSAVQTKLNAVGGGGAVASVAGKTGTVSLVKADVGLSAVDNTADASKPVSSPVQAALNTKAAAVTANAGIWIGTQAAYNALGTYAATTLYVISE